MKRILKPLLCALPIWLGSFPVHGAAAGYPDGCLGMRLVRPWDHAALTADYVAVHGPAANAGIKTGDTITSIDGVETAGITTADAYRFTTGKIGATVKISFIRDNSPTRTVSMEQLSALETYSPAATEGDPVAEYEIARFYASSSPPGIGEAVAWYFKSANHGYAPAQASLGAMYLYGNGLPQNDRDAFAWFYSAAVQDDPNAQQQLAQLYKEGRGAPANLQDAFAWFHRSAELGNPYAAWHLAGMYQLGLGTHASISEALVWYRKASNELPGDTQLSIALFEATLQSIFHDAGSAAQPGNTVALYRNWIAWTCATLVFVFLSGSIALFLITLARPAGQAPRLRTALCWIAFYIVGQFIVGLAILMYGGTFTLQGLFYICVLCCAVPTILCTFGLNRKLIWQPSRAPWPRVIIYGLAGYAMVYLIATFYMVFYVALTHNHLPAQPTRALITSAKHSSSWLTYANVAFIVPVAEEILFRCYLLDTLRKRFSAFTSIAASSFLFSFAHFQPFYFIPLFGLGAALGWARWKTSSLRLPILLHAINNAFAIIATR